MEDITFWRGKNLGPQRKAWMKKNLRLEEIEITEDDIDGIVRSFEQMRSDGVHIVLRPGIYPESYRKLTHALLNLFNGDGQKA